MWTHLIKVQISEIPYKKGKIYFITLKTRKGVITQYETKTAQS